MIDAPQEKQSPAAFLAGLGTELKQQAQSDDGLTDILCAHILKTAPHKDAVVHARAAISKLAAERAAPPKADVPHDG